MLKEYEKVITLQIPQSTEPTVIFPCVSLIIDHTKNIVNGS
jgi:hypothetical protein